MTDGLHTDIASLQRHVDRKFAELEKRASTRMSRAAPWISLVTTALLVPVAGFLWSHESEQNDRIEGNHDSLRIIEATRFTGAQGHAMEARILSVIEGKYPPPWLRQKVEVIEATVEKNATKLDALDDRLTRLEARIK